MARITPAVGTIASSLLLGCSFVTVSGPPSAPEERTEKAATECTTVVTPPVVDANLAFWTGVLLMVAAARAESEGWNVDWIGFDMTPGTTLAIGATNFAVFGSSATYGFIQTSRCRALKEEVQANKPLWSPARSSVPPLPTMAPTQGATPVPSSSPPGPTAPPTPAS